MNINVLTIHQNKIKVKKMSTKVKVIIHRVCIAQVFISMFQNSIDFYCTTQSS